MSEEEDASTEDAPKAPPAPKGDFVPPVILRNRGVPVTLYRLQDGQLPDPPDDLDDDDEWEPPKRKVHLRFTANHIAEIEEAFDGLVAEDAWKDEDDEVHRERRTYYGTEAFQKALEVKTNSTLRRVLAIAFEMDEQAMGNAMIPTDLIVYNNAVGVAWSISQGVDPTEAARMLQKADAAVAAQRAALASQLEEMMDEAEESTTDSPGETG